MMKIIADRGEERRGQERRLQERRGVKRRNERRKNNRRSYRRKLSDAYVRGGWELTKSEVTAEEPKIDKWG